jgi:hypothetical protein
MTTVKIVTPQTYFAETYDQWITPAYPDWYKNLKVARDISIQDHIKTARECPAFVHLFKNAHLVRAPMDISIHYDPQKGVGWKMAQGTGEDVSPFNKISGFNFEVQMAPEWGKYMSVKLDFQAVLIPEESTECLFFDPMYHQDNRIPMTAMTGVWTMHPKLYTILGVNYMLDPEKSFDKDGYMHISRGTPLAYLYWPNGKPSIEVEICTREEWSEKHEYTTTMFRGDFLKKEKELKDAV